VPGRRAALTGGVQGESPVDRLIFLPGLSTGLEAPVAPEANRVAPEANLIDSEVKRGCSVAGDARPEALDATAILGQ